MKSPGIVESENFYLRILHSFCVLGEYAESISAPMENVRKVSMRTWRIRDKYLGVYGEYGKLGLFAVHKSSPITWKVFKRIRRMRGKNLCIHGEDAKILLAYSPNTPKDIKVCISRLIIILCREGFL